MEYIENTEMEDKTITIFTDSQVTLDALRNNTNHTFLIEAIRKKGAEMSRTNWEIQFCWVKAHVADLYSSQNIFRIIKSRRMRLSGHVERMRTGEAYTGFWWGNLKERHHLGDSDVDGIRK